MDFIQGQFYIKDLFIAPVYIFLIWYIFYLFRPKKSNISKYYFKGLFLKLFGCFIFWFIHCWLYRGGDSWAYFYSSKAIANLILTNPSNAWLIISNKVTGLDMLNLFNIETGYPAFYMVKDTFTFNVAKNTSILTILGFKSFLITSLLLASVSYVGIWKLFLLVCELYPKLSKSAFYIIIAMPSLLFWGSGIMKDTYVLSAGCWFVYNFYMFFIKRKKMITNLLLILINISIVINIKSYLLLSLIPGCLLWLNSTYINKVKNNIIKIILFPFLVLVIVSIGVLSFQNLSGFMGKYGNVDSALQQAQVIQKDLLNEEVYGKNNYYLGELDGDFSDIISLAPIAIFTAIFRPLPWEIGSPTMVISAIENTILLLITISLVIRISPLKVLSYILKEPFLVMALSFSLFFSFGVGIASTNFGALVRYKIPLMPFFFMSIFIIKYLNNIELNE